MFIRSLLRRLPPDLKAWIWQVLDRIGPWPHRIAAGPARGLLLVAPRQRSFAYCGGDYEPHVVAALSRLVQPGMVACDIGSHLGYLTLVLARLVGPSGRVYAFEPLRRHVKLLRRTLARNRLAQVTVVAQAVGERTGLATLEEWPNDAMNRIAGGTAVWKGKTVQVPMTTLDDWAARMGGLERLDLIKLDVEGQELAALQGTAGLLRRCRTRIVCEIHRRDDVPYQPEEVVAWLQAAQYDVTLIPSSAYPHETLAAAFDRLRTAELPPGWMAVAHVLATPREE
jgi:FkbM family methyltransferase